MVKCQGCDAYKGHLVKGKLCVSCDKNKKSDKNNKQNGGASASGSVAHECYVTTSDPKDLNTPISGMHKG